VFCGLFIFAKEHIFSTSTLERELRAIVFFLNQRSCNAAENVEDLT
jgi:hypothetical protein